jgi:hypothetical protein
MHYQTRFLARRIINVLATASMIVALGGAVTACAKEATRTTATGNAATEFSDSTQTPDTVDPAAIAPASIEAEAPTTPTSTTSANPAVVTQTTLPRPDEFQVLVTMLETGGMCAGPCGEVQTTIYSDGTWSYGAAPNPDQTVTATTLPPLQGQLDDTLTQQLKTALANVTATELQGLPVTQQYCPSAADGRDLSFTYRLQGTEVTVSNCQVDLLEANELLRLTSLARDDIAITANQKG